MLALFAGGGFDGVNMSKVIEKLTEIVRLTAREEILPRYEQIGHREKADGSLVTEADLAMQSRLADQLRQLWPDYGFLGEEMTEAEQAGLLCSHEALWCLDPLDGTSNFASGLPFFAVSLALLRGGRSELGLVYDPVRDECFAAVRGEGATLNGRILGNGEQPDSLKKCIAVVDFKRLKPALASQLVTAPPFRSQRNLGSCALEWAWLAAGRYQLYLHGGQKLWDHAAGTVIQQEAGGACRTLAGDVIMANTLEPRSAVAAVNADLWQQWQQWLANEPAGHH